MEYIRSKRGRAHDALILNCKRRKRGRVDDVALVLRLPEHLISDILLRLPIESISCCKCVCKTLEKILRDPQFAELHLTNSSETDRRLVIPYKTRASSLFLFHMLDLDNISDISPQGSNYHDRDPRPWKAMVIPPIVSQTECAGVAVFGSCNGLLGLRYLMGKNSMLYVCNPILGEFMLLPEPKRGDTIEMFGFCPNAKQYKVVRFISRSEPNKDFDYLTSYSLCEIHTLGTNSWRTIGDVISPLFFNSTHLNGNLHWVTYGIGFSVVICSFNLEAERVFDIPSPPLFNQRDIKRRLDSLSVGVMGGLLCVSYVLDRIQFEVFVMKNYGVKDSWTKQFTIDTNFNSGLQATSEEASLVQFMRKGKPLRVVLLDNGDLLLYYLASPLIYYSPQKGRVWDILEFATKGRNLSWLTGVTYARYYVPSLISLKEIAGSENVQIVQPRKLSDNWSHKKVPRRRR